MRGPRLRVPPRRQRRRALRHRAPAQGPRAEHDRDLQRAGGDARQRRAAHRVLLDRLDLRRAERLPDAGGRAVPGADVALRRLEAGRRGADPGLLRTGFGFQGYIFRFVSILGERYTHGHVFDFYRKLRGRPDAASTCSATASSASRTCTSRTASTRCCTAIDKAPDAGQRLQPRHRRILRGRTTRSAGSASTWASTPSGVYTGGERGWIGDSPFIFLDTTKVRAPGLEAEADDPRGRVMQTLDYLQRQCRGCSNPRTVEARCQRGLRECL